MASSFAPGAVVADVDRQFESSTSLICNWLKTCLATVATPAFASAILVEAPEPHPVRPRIPAVLIELPDGARVSIAANAPAALVAATLKVLRP